MCSCIITIIDFYSERKKIKTQMYITFKWTIRNAKNNKQNVFFETKIFLFFSYIANIATKEKHKNE